MLAWRRKMRGGRILNHWIRSRSKQVCVDEKRDRNPFIHTIGKMKRQVLNRSMKSGKLTIFCGFFYCKEWITLILVEWVLQIEPEESVGPSQFLPAEFSKYCTNTPSGKLVRII